jgi:glycosyltransferase involved in cell wall biosynthesis
MKLISVVTPCYNEAENISDVYSQVKEVFAVINGYDYEHIFIDNASNDRTVVILKELAAKDKRVKIIVNARNFGPIRSAFYGYLQGRGDAVIPLVADLQNPPSLILDFIKKWEEGYLSVVGVKKRSQEFPLMLAVRGYFYKLIGALSEVEQIENFMGFGLFDRKVIDVLRKIDDPYPYFRGLIAEFGFNIARVEYNQPARKRGKTKIPLYTLYDAAMNGITNYSRIPLRLATILGFLSSICCLFVALGYLFYKLIFWNNFDVGMAPLVIGFFLFTSVQLFFIGILGEYIGAIQTQVLKRPLVVEKERINF